MLSMIDDVYSKINEELSKNLSELDLLPREYLRKGKEENGPEGLIERAEAINWLEEEIRGKVRLSKETREREEERIFYKKKPRKKYTWHNGRKHWKTRKNTKKRYLNKLWKVQPLERLKYAFRQPVLITQEEWDEYVKPIWDRYDRKYLKIKVAPKSGNKLTVWNMQIFYIDPDTKKSSKIYDGNNCLLDRIQNEKSSAIPVDPRKFRQS